MASPLRGHTLVYGGSFNPPHMGHQLACRYVLDVLGAQALWVVPVCSHPFGKDLVSFEHRVQMCRLMIEPFADRAWVNTIEQDLPDPVRTFELFTALKQEYPDREFAMLMGADLLAERERWYRFEDLEKLVKIVVVERKGTEVSTDEGIFKAELPQVSSREVRSRLEADESVEGLVPLSIQDYLFKEALYNACP